MADEFLSTEEIESRHQATWMLADKIAVVISAVIVLAFVVLVWHLA